MKAQIVIQNCNHPIDVILTKKDLINALSEFNDDDEIVIEIDETTPIQEDLYFFYIDALKGLAIKNGKNNRTEIRFCPVSMSDLILPPVTDML
jgi:hypothetical protein